MEWNVENHLVVENQNLQDLLPSKIYLAYKKSLENAKFLHFSSSLKPWQDSTSYNAHLFWKYARLTPFYEEMVYKNKFGSTTSTSVQDKKFYSNFFERIFSLKNLNANNKKFKVITIIGIKIKLKLKRRNK